MIAALAVAAVCGLVIGCFLNTLAYRLTTDRKTVITEDCICPVCGHTLALWEQIPIVGYLVLRGKCRYCRAEIDGHYPLVEGGCAILYAVLAGICLPRLPLFLLLCLAACAVVTAWLVRRGGGISHGKKTCAKILSASALMLFYHLLIAAAVGIVLIA